MVLAFVTAFYFGGQSFQNRTKQELRTVTLEQTQIDYQSILDGFDDAELTIDGTFLDFVGSQKIDASVFEELDNLSVSEKEELQGNNIQYHFTYDIETNIITISAEITLPNGEIIFDTISGVGFYDENGEIDAVMNVDGEGILLSEMRNAGMIGNVGLFSRILKAIAVVAVAVAVVAVVVAVVVVTAGAAAPALVAAGVGVVGAAGGTAAIAGTALTVAVIAAGVAVVAGSALVIDNALQNIG